MLDFEKVIPEDVGISSTGLISFARKLEYNNIPMHSIIVMRHGKICMESYYAPYTRDTLHRMFSVTKSFVSLAIGLLADEGESHLMTILQIIFLKSSQRQAYTHICRCSQ